MNSNSLAIQAYTKRWKRARREEEKLRKALQTEMFKEQDARDAAWAEQAVQEAAVQFQHQEQLQGPQIQLVEEIKEEPEFMAVPTSSVTGSVATESELALWGTTVEVDDTSDTSSEEDSPQDSVRNFLQHWALKHQIPHSALDDLLLGLNAHGHEELPSSARTLLSTSRDIRSAQVSGMEYVHFGLRRTIEGQLRCVVCNAPAKAMIEAAKLCTGYYVCEKCVQNGNGADGRVTYPDVQNTLRTREMSARETEGQFMTRKAQTNLFFSNTSAMTHDREEGDSAVDTVERIVEAHMGHLIWRIDGLEAKVKSLITRKPSPQPLFQEDLLLAPCRTVSELEELDKGLVQQDRRIKMQLFLASLGGANAGAAIRRILRKVATNDVLAQYSLRGRRAKKSFQELVLCRVIILACMRNFPGQTKAEIEECIGQTLKFAPHRR